MKTHNRSRLTSLHVRTTVMGGNEKGERKKRSNSQLPFPHHQNEKVHAKVARGPGRNYTVRERERALCDKTAVTKAVLKRTDPLKIVCYLQYSTAPTRWITPPGQTHAATLPH